MASLHQLLSALQSEVSSVTTGLPDLTVGVGIDWPSPKTLMNNVRGGSGLVSVFDRKLTRNTTRWNPTPIGGTLQNPTITGALSSGVIQPAGTTLLVLAGTVTAGDSISLVVTNGQLFGTDGLPPRDLTFGGFVFGESSFGNASGTQIYSPTAAVVITATDGQTFAQLATAMAAAVNANTTLAAWISATAVGPVITLTSLVANLLTVQSLIGNTGTSTIEIARRMRQLQVTAWARSIEDRDTISNPIETMIALMETFQDPYGAGLPLADGTVARLELVSDFELDQATPQDTYRRDFLVSVDYPITTTDTLYTVLAPVFQYQLGYTD